MSKKKVAKKKKPLSFEQSLESLETIVAKLEGGQLGLADSLEQYEAGVQHLKSCYELLSAAERRIELVSGLDASGKPRTEDFHDSDEESLEEKGAARSKRRSSKTPAKRRSGEVDDGSSLF